MAYKHLLLIAFVFLSKNSWCSSTDETAEDLSKEKIVLFYQNIGSITNPLELKESFIEMIDKIYQHKEKTISIELFINECPDSLNDTLMNSLLEYYPPLF